MSTHGDSRSSEYSSWRHAKDRCESPTFKSYRNYGGRGIRVCARWQDFPTFLQDMGRKPTPAHTLERLDSNGNYEPWNCVWATRHEQNRNKRTNVWVILLGERMILQDARKILGITGLDIKKRRDGEGETHQQVIDFYATLRGLNK